VVLGAPMLSGMLRWKPLAFVGMISYSMFLIHSTVMAMIARYTLPYVRGLAVSAQSSLMVWGAFFAYALGVFAVIAIISYLGYRYIESPFLLRKRTKEPEPRTDH